MNFFEDPGYIFAQQFYDEVKMKTQEEHIPLSRKGLNIWKFL